MNPVPWRTLPGFGGWPADLPLPPVLRDLIAWDPVGHRLPQGLEICLDPLPVPWPDDPTEHAWFVEQAPRLGAFMAESDGSLYALWDDGKGHLPVVFISSDGDPNVVVAADIDDFLMLLTVGYNSTRLQFPSLLRTPPQASDGGPVDGELSAYRSWIAQRLNRPPLSDGAALVQRVLDTPLGAFEPWLHRMYGWTTGGVPED